MVVGVNGGEGEITKGCETIVEGRKEGVEAFCEAQNVKKDVEDEDEEEGGGCGGCGGGEASLLFRVGGRDPRRGGGCGGVVESERTDTGGMSNGLQRETRFS